MGLERLPAHSTVSSYKTVTALVLEEKAPIIITQSSLSPLC